MTSSHSLVMKLWHEHKASSLQNVWQCKHSNHQGHWGIDLTKRHMKTLASRCKHYEKELILEKDQVQSKFWWQLRLWRLRPQCGSFGTKHTILYNVYPPYRQFPLTPVTRIQQFLLSWPDLLRQSWLWSSKVKIYQLQFVHHYDGCYAAHPDK